MSFLTKIKSFYSNFHLSTSKSILIAGAMISISIYSGSEEIKWKLHTNGWQISNLLEKQNSYLGELNESIKVAGEKAQAPVTLDKQTFDRIFEICMSSTSEGISAAGPEFNFGGQKHCLNNILRTDIK